MQISFQAGSQTEAESHSGATVLPWYVLHGEIMACFFLFYFIWFGLPFLSPGPQPRLMSDYPDFWLNRPGVTFQ